MKTLCASAIAIIRRCIDGPYWTAMKRHYSHGNFGWKFRFAMWWHRWPMWLWYYKRPQLVCKVFGHVPRGDYGHNDITCDRCGADLGPDSGEAPWIPDNDPGLVTADALGADTVIGIHGVEEGRLAVDHTIGVVYRLDEEGRITDIEEFVDPRNKRLAEDTVDRLAWAAYEEWVAAMQ